MDILGPDPGKMTIYGSDFQQVNLTPNGGVSPTDNTPHFLKWRGIISSKPYKQIVIIIKSKLKISPVSYSF